MRNRFFFIILSSLILSAVGINLIHIYFFKNQRLKLIDRQITESAQLLLASEKFKKSIHIIDSVDDSITVALQGARIGKVFVIRDQNGKIAYQSFNVGLLKADLPVEPDWVTVETEDEYVRINNKKLPDGYTLQVGLVLNQNFLNWEIVDTRVIVYVSGIVLALFILTALLTLVLLSPLRMLISHLREATSNLTNMKDVRALPGPLLAHANGYWSKADEFSDLLSTVQKLIDRINLNYKLTRSWTSQMAHELKTPLAIIKLETEANAKSGVLKGQYAKDVLEEVLQMTEIIGQFLDWAELENSQGQKDLHAVRIKTLIKNVTSRLEKMSPGRLILKMDADFSVFANPIHLDQLIANLIMNALKFSPVTEKVEVILAENFLMVKDSGSGFPTEVLERLGQPFNVGTFEGRNVPGNGLGLAWVSTVAKLYNWSFDIRSSAHGTVVIVRFLQDEEAGDE